VNDSITPLHVRSLCHLAYHKANCVPACATVAHAFTIVCENVLCVADAVNVGIGVASLLPLLLISSLLLALLLLLSSPLAMLLLLHLSMLQLLLFLQLFARIINI
jgi:hypothetical protein